MKKFLSLLLAVMMVVSLMPVQAFAQALENAETTIVEPETEQEPQPSIELEEEPTQQEEPAVEPQADGDITEGAKFSVTSNAENLQVKVLYQGKAAQAVEVPYTLDATADNNCYFKVQEFSAEGYTLKEISVTVDGKTLTHKIGDATTKVAAFKEAFGDSVTFGKAPYVNYNTISDTLAYVCFTSSKDVTVHLEFEKDSTLVTTGKAGENITWNYDEATKTLTFTGEGDMADGEAEDSMEYASYPVEKVVIGEGITGIGKYKLSFVTVNDSEKQHNTTLKEIVFPSTIKTINQYAFAYIDGIEVFTLPEGIEDIPAAIFLACDGVKEVTMPSTIKTVSRYTYSGLDNLERVVLPSSVTSIGSMAFRNYTALKELTLSENLTTIGSRAFQGCTGISEIIIPENVTSIGSYAFSGWTADQTIRFALTEEEVKAKGIDLGSGWSGSATVKYKDSENSFAGEKIKWSYDEATKVLTFTGSGEMFDYTDKQTQWHDLKPETITFSGAITGISAYSLVFDDGSSVKNINLVNTITSIGNGAFKGLTGMSKFTVTENIKSIGTEAFSGWTAEQTIAFDMTKKNAEKNITFADGWNNNCAANIEYKEAGQTGLMPGYNVTLYARLAAVVKYDDITPEGTADLVLPISDTRKTGYVRLYTYPGCTLTSESGTVKLISSNVNYCNYEISKIALGEGKLVKFTVTNEDGDSKDYVFTITYGYEVNLTQPEGGVIAKNDKGSKTATFKEGETVTLYADPNPGMALDSWVLECVNSADPVAVVDANDSNIATFTMPKESVSVTAIFRPLKDGEEFNGARIESFTVENGSVVIDQAASTIKITLNYGSDITKVVPTIVVSKGATVTPASGEERDFTYSGTYTVSKNGVSHKYTVTALVSAMAKGTGTKDDPIRIENVDDLILFRNSVNSGTSYDGMYVVQTNDLDLSQFGEAWEPIGTVREDNSYASVPNKPFMGIYDGQNHKILNMKCVFSASERAKGFFGAVKNATIKNLVIDESCYIKASMYLGGVAGLAVNSIFENCVNHADVYATAYVTGGASDFRKSYSGGICGSADSTSMIVKCSNTGAIGCDATASGWGYSGPGCTGGVVGGGKATLILCSNSGSISGGGYTGGVVGEGTAIGCWNTGKVEGNYKMTIGDSMTTLRNGVGGVVGTGTAENCYNKGSVTGSWIGVGGVAGSGTVNNSYNVGAVSSTYAGEYPAAMGQLLGYTDKGAADMKNLFYATDGITGAVGYDSATKDGAEGNPASEEMMLGSEMLEALMDYTSETLQKAEWMADLSGSNGGYPVLIDYSIKPSGEKDIISAKLGLRAGVIDKENRTITFAVGYGEDISNVALTLTISDGAKVSPASNEKVDFSKGPVTYTVTAADGSTKEYTTIINAASSPDGFAYLDVTYYYTGNDPKYRQLSYPSLFEGITFEQGKYEYTVELDDCMLMSTTSTLANFGVYVIPATKNAVATASFNGSAPVTLKNRNTIQSPGTITSSNKLPYLSGINIGKNTIVITVTNPGSTESVTYTINLIIHPTIKSFVINDDASSISPKFDSNITEYTINLQDSVTELPVSYQTSFSGKSTAVEKVKLTNPEGTIAFTKDVSGNATYEGNVTITPEMNEFQITVAGAAEGAESKTYTFKLNRIGTYEVEFTSNVENAVIRVYDKDGNKLTPDENGKYIFTRGETYSYTATAKGYVSAAGTVTSVDQLTDGKFVISLEKVSGVKYPDLGAYWPTFRGNDENMAVTDVKTPKSESETSLLWANKAGIGYNSGAVSSPIIVGGYIYAYAGTSIMKIDKQTGVTVAAADMVGSSSFSIVPPTYADGMIFVGLSGGRVQAFRADTLESLWVYKDELGGQPNSQIVYKDGCVYTGFWVSESKDANFVCIDASDEDPTNPTEEKYALWTYTQAGGFYWAGAYATDKFIVVTTDDGKSGSNSTGSSIIVFDKDTGAKVSSVDNLYGDLRSNVAYDEASNRVYFTSKGGYLYSVSINWATGEIDASSLKSIALGGMSTSTPVVHNGRAYVGVSGTGQFVEYSGHNITVIDLSTWTVAYKAYTKGYPQTSALVSSAYEGSDGYTYVYFTENYTPGAIRYIKDKAGQTALVDGVMENGQLCAPILYTPGENLAQYCICSPIVDENGTLFFKNDTGYMMAVSVTAESLEIAQKPSSITENGDGTVTTEGMKVYVVLKNGEKVDVSKYVTVTADGDVSYKVTYTYGSEIAEGVKTLTASFVDDDKAAAKAVDDLINAIGKVELTGDCKAKIDAAREAYDKLTDAQKELVKNLQTLTDAEAEYQKLLDQKKADEAAAKAVDDIVSKLQPVTLESGDAIEAARKAFDALTPDQKKLLDPETEGKLVAAENEYKKLVKEDADKKAAKEVEDKIAALQPVTKDSGDAIKDARSSYEALTPEQKDLVSKDALKELEKAEKAYDMIKNSEKPDASDKGDKSDSGVIKITTKGDSKGEQNPNTGAPAMSIAPAMLVLAAAVLVLKKRG